MSAMAKQRTEFERVVRDGWFAWVYWGVTAVGICAVGAIWIWAPDLLVISGYVVITLVIGLLVGRYVLAAKLKREGDTAAGPRP
jgi:hypothetical protein